MRADLPFDNDTSHVFLPFDANMGLEAPTLLGDISHSADILRAQDFVTDCVLYNSPTLDVRDGRAAREVWFREAKALVQTRCSNMVLRGSMDDYGTMAMTFAAGMTNFKTRAQPHDLSTLINILRNFDIRAEERVSKENVSNIGATRWLEGQWRGLLRFCYNRRFFITIRGRMGLGPRCLQAGDIVAVLRGAMLPFILRKEVEDYRLLGAAYVHGIMDGEAVEEWKTRDEPEIVFRFDDRWLATQ
jgi:hypothetical protein